MTLAKQQSKTSHLPLRPWLFRLYIKTDIVLGKKNQAVISHNATFLCSEHFYNTTKDKVANCNVATTVGQF